MRYVGQVFLGLWLLSAPALAAEMTVEQVKQEVLKELRAEGVIGPNAPQAPVPVPTAPLPPITGTEPTGPRQGMVNASAFNPAMGLVLDTVFGATRLNRGQFDFRSAELNLAAPVDPFVNLYGIFNGTPDGVSVEEAFFMTTALPWNLTVRGGRMFANFGRLGHWHDHELPFVNRVRSLDTFIGGEAQGDGLEVMHLFRTPFFLQGTLGAYNKLGADNNRLQQTVGQGSGNVVGRSGYAFTYLARLLTYVPIGDNFGVDVGASDAWTPREFYVDGMRVDDSNTGRHLTGMDFTFRFEPVADNVYRKLIWGSEVFRNDERHATTNPVGLDTNSDGLGDAPLTTTARTTAWGGYSYVDWRFARQWSAGGFVDLSEDLANNRATTTSVGPTLNFLASEFQRLRLQYSEIRRNDNTPADHQIYLQWFMTIGSHVHVFKDR